MGSVYKTRERIHRDEADSRLLAIPASWSRVADSNPYLGRFWEICLVLPLSGLVVPFPLYHVCSPGHKGHADLTSFYPSSRLNTGSLFRH
jgi:hypothetical protein